MAKTRCLRMSLLLAYCAFPFQGSCSQTRYAELTVADAMMAGVSRGQVSVALAPRPSDASDAAQIDASQLQKAGSLTEAGDYAGAESTIRNYLLKHANSAEGHYLLGYVLYRQNQPTKSLAEYTEGARYRNPSPADLAAVAMDYVLLGADANADKWLTRAISMEPSNGLYWYYLGRTKYEENRFEEAVDAFQKCLELMPHNVRAEYNLGLAYAGKSLDDKAIDAYETAIAWQRGTAHEDPQPYLDLGMLLADQGHLQESVPDLEKAVKLDAQNPKIHEQMGRLYEQLHEMTKAQKELESAVALAPKISSLHFQLGRIYQKEGMTDRAKAEFARCAVLNGTHSTDSSETPNADFHP